MRIDLHTHSPASDGTDTPGDVVRAAQAAGLDVVALTDHDAMSGWAEAAQAADEVGITLVPRAGDQHGLPPPRRAPAGLPPRPDRTRRSSRRSTGSWPGAPPGRPRSWTRCARHGIEITEDDVRRESGGSVAAGRPHVADALVRLGVRRRPHPGVHRPAQPRQARLRQPLRRAARGDDPARRPAAGGVAVIAHPWGRSGADRARRRGAGATCATSGWPGSRSTTRTTAPDRARAARRSPPTSTSSSPAAATTTGSARSTTTSGSTRPILSSTSGWSRARRRRGACLRAYDARWLPA